MVDVPRFVQKIIETPQNDEMFGDFGIIGYLCTRKYLRTRRERVQKHPTTDNGNDNEQQQAQENPLRKDELGGSSSQELLLCR